LKKPLVNGTESMEGEMKNYLQRAKTAVKLIKKDANQAADAEDAKKLEEIALTMDDMIKVAKTAVKDIASLFKLIKDKEIAKFETLKEFKTKALTLFKSSDEFNDLAGPCVDALKKITNFYPFQGKPDYKAVVNYLKDFLGYYEGQTIKDL
jgi:hypothetical protein